MAYLPNLNYFDEKENLIPILLCCTDTRENAPLPPALFPKLTEFIRRRSNTRREAKVQSFLRLAIKWVGDLMPVQRERQHILNT